MLDKNYILPADAVRKLIHNLKENTHIERLKIEECYGRVLAEDIKSPEHLPQYPRSTVDGFAVNSADTYGATENLPVYLTVSCEIPMGVAPNFELKKLQSAKIYTGGILPKGADAVVMIENTQEISPTEIEVTRSVSAGENIISKGEDFKENEIIAPKGKKLRPHHIGAFASVGITHLSVYKIPTVAIISTGDEIVSHDSVLQPGKIRDINSFTLYGLVKEEGAIANKKGIFKDDYYQIKDALINSLEDSDLVLISGGTSAGSKDMVLDILNDLGNPGIIFHGVAMKPGKPLIGAIINNKPVLGLPGHPVAVEICFYVFVRPLLRILSGETEPNKVPETKRLKAKIAKNVASVAGREDYIAVTLKKEDNDTIAYPLIGKSGLISLLAKADGYIVIPYNKTGINISEEVIVNIF
ncbi:MAG: molybdopterin molybdotransferase MoeA [Thermodesulfovibrionales bacterium]|nr:molybdopterin molybdotransferase MoeA [Thermodesulfovibrionales bacterium]